MHGGASLSAVIWTLGSARWNRFNHNFADEEYSKAYGLQAFNHVSPFALVTEATLGRKLLCSGSQDRQWGDLPGSGLGFEGLEVRVRLKLSIKLRNIRRVPLRVLYGIYRV